MKGFGKRNERAIHTQTQVFYTFTQPIYAIPTFLFHFDSSIQRTKIPFGSFILGRVIFLWYISTMAVFDVEFLTIILSAFVISRIDPVVNLLHRVRARAPYHRLDSSWTDDLSPTRRCCVRRCSKAHSEELQRQGSVCAEGGQRGAARLLFYAFLRFRKWKLFWS